MVPACESVGIIASSSAPGPENLLRFEEQILAVDIQLDAVAVRQPLYPIVDDTLRCDGHTPICKDPIGSNAAPSVPPQVTVAFAPRLEVISHFTIVSL
jgi:hypothetical protein